MGGTSDGREPVTGHYSKALKFVIKRAVDFSRRALPEKLESEVSRCCDGKHSEQRGQHSNEIANVLHFPLPVEGASR